MDATLALYSIGLLAHAAVRESMPDSSLAERGVVAEGLAAEVSLALGASLEDLGRAAELGRSAPFSAPQPR